MHIDIHGTTGPRTRSRLAPRLAVALALIVPGLAAAQEPATPDSVGPEATPLEQLVADLAGAEGRVDRVEENLAAAPPAEQEVFEFQRRRRWLEHHSILLRLGGRIEGAGLGTVDSAVVAQAIAGLERERATIDTWLEDVNAQLLQVRQTLEDAPPDQRLQGEIELGQLYQNLGQLLGAESDDLELGTALGLDLQDALASHQQNLEDHAEFTSASLELAVEQLAAERIWLGRAGVDTVAVRQRITAIEERIRTTTASLRELVGLLGRLAYDTADYRALIVSATGQLGTQVLDRRVLADLVSRWTTSLLDWGRENLGVVALRFVVIVLLLLAAGRLAALARRIVKHALHRATLTSLVRNLFVSASATVVWGIVGLVILSLLGIDLAPMLAGLGIAGFVVGFALQDTLGNFAAGLMIMIYRPFDVGDFVTAAGVTGEVKRLTLVSTVIRTLDNQRIIVPNGKLWGDVINNATAEHVRRVDLVFGIGYGDDVDHARRVLEDILDKDDLVLDEPAPVVRVTNLGDSSVDLICRPWCRTEDYWEVKWELTRAVKKRFDAEGITIPFPQRDVHLYETRGDD